MAYIVLKRKKMSKNIIIEKKLFLKYAATIASRHDAIWRHRGDHHIHGTIFETVLWKFLLKLDFFKIKNVGCQKVNMGRTARWQANDFHMGTCAADDESDEKSSKPVDFFWKRFYPGSYNAPFCDCWAKSLWACWDAFSCKKPPFPAKRCLQVTMFYAGGPSY